MISHLANNIDHCNRLIRFDKAHRCLHCNQHTSSPNASTKMHTYTGCVKSKLPHIHTAMTCSNCCSIKEMKHKENLHQQQQPLGCAEPTGLGADLPFSVALSLITLRVPWPRASGQREGVSCCRSAKLLLIFAYPQRDG